MDDSTLGLLAAVAAGLAAVIWVALPNLRAERAERGVVALALACTRDRADRILADWDERRLTGAARFSVKLDFLLIPAYTAALALFAAAVSDDAWPVYAALAPGLLDLLENVGMLHILGQDDDDDVAAWVPPLTSLAATLKFALILLVAIAVALTA